MEFHRLAVQLSLCDAVTAADGTSGFDDSQVHAQRAYWTRVTRGLDLSDADRVDPLVYNRILWKGVMHNKPLPLSLRKAHSDDDDDDDQPRESPRPAS